jgi:hypothetical protein
MSEIMPFAGHLENAYGGLKEGIRLARTCKADSIEPHHYLIALFKGLPDAAALSTESSLGLTHVASQCARDAV